MRRRYPVRIAVPLCVIVLSSLLGCVKKSDPPVEAANSSTAFSESGSPGPAPKPHINAEIFGGGGAAERAMAIARKALQDALKLLVTGTDRDSLCEPIEKNLGSDRSNDVLLKLDPEKRELVRGFILENLRIFQERLNTAAFDFSSDPIEVNGQGVLAKAPLGGEGPIVFYTKGTLAAEPRGRVRLLGHEITHTFKPAGFSDAITDTEQTPIFPEPDGGRKLADTVGICFDGLTRALQSRNSSQITDTLAIVDHDRVKLFRKDGAIIYDFSPYGHAALFYLVTADLNNDQIQDIVTIPIGRAVGELGVFMGGSMDSSNTLRPRVLPHPLHSHTISGLNDGGATASAHGLALGDINGDKTKDILVSGGGSSNKSEADYNYIRAYSGVDRSKLYDFDPWQGDGTSINETFLVASDFTGDGVADIVASALRGSAGGPVPEVRIFVGGSKEASNPSAPRRLEGLLGRIYYPFGKNENNSLGLEWNPDLAFAQNMKLATGDIDGDGSNDIIVALEPGFPRVRVISGKDGTELYDFFPELDREPAFRQYYGGTELSVIDVNADLVADIVTLTYIDCSQGQSKPAAPPRIQVWLGGTRDEVAPNQPVRFSGKVGNFYPEGLTAGCSVPSLGNFSR